MTLKEAKANARLIAAAPEMLNVLKAILDIDNPPDGHPNHIPKDVLLVTRDQDFKNAFKRARRIVAQATGGEA